MNSNNGQRAGPSTGGPSNLPVYPGRGDSSDPIFIGDHNKQYATPQKSGGAIQAPTVPAGFAVNNDNSPGIGGQSQYVPPTLVRPKIMGLKRYPAYPDGNVDNSPGIGGQPRNIPPTLVRPKIMGLKNYPFYPDGDVVIISPNGMTWKLHSEILSKSSRYFEKVFMANPPAVLSKKEKQEGKTVRWKLDMVREYRANEMDPESVVFKHFQCVPVGSRSQTFQNFNGIGQELEFIEIYDNIFRILYHLKPTFMNGGSTESSMRLAIQKISQTLTAATYIEAVHAIRVTLESALLRMSEVLWIHIAARPEGWLPIAARLQSDIMFRECMMHIVGRYHIKGGIDESFLRNPMHGDMGKKFWELIVRKAEELKAKKLWAERHLIEWYPPRMVHPEDEVQATPKSTYGTDVYFWIALNLVRQYISSAYVSNYHHRASDGGISFYRTIGADDPDYLRPTTLERFHIAFDMSTRAKKLLAEALETIKKDISEIVKPLLVDHSQATKSIAPPFHGTYKHGHFTCTEILESDLPWFDLDEEEETGNDGFSPSGGRGNGRAGEFEEMEISGL